MTYVVVLITTLKFGIILICIMLIKKKVLVTINWERNKEKEKERDRETERDAKLSQDNPNLIGKAVSTAIWDSRHLTIKDGYQSEALELLVIFASSSLPEKSQKAANRSCEELRNHRLISPWLY